MDIFEKQAELNQKKRILQLRNSVDDAESYALEWLALAREYEEIDARANHVFCLGRYNYYRTSCREEEEELEEELIEPEFDWQDRKDMGD